MNENFKLTIFFTFRYNVYVTMFYKVMGTFFFFLLWYAFFIIAFGLAFYIMLHKDDGSEIGEDDYIYFNNVFLFSF